MDVKRADELARIHSSGHNCMVDPVRQARLRQMLLDGRIVELHNEGDGAVFNNCIVYDTETPDEL